MTQAFIERQFPVSKVSKESYKERKANNGQTLTGLGKWWGRKPLAMVRAAILGCLMPASDNPERDMEIFLKIMSMDEDGLLLRKEKKFTTSDLYDAIRKRRNLWAKYDSFFDVSSDKLKLKPGAPRDEMEIAAFRTLGYDAKIAMCKRPEQLKAISEHAWKEINHHLKTSAGSLPELVNQLSQRRFGRNAVVGDCFCGGGSIPFEAARMGCDVYASDLNPIAGLLTWAGLNICGASEDELAQIRCFQQKVYDEVDAEIAALGIEHNELGDRAVSYLYCIEARCPECGIMVPLAPSWVIGKGTRTVAILNKNGDRFDISVKMDATAKEMKAAESGTVSSRGMECPHCGKTTPISVLRRDRTGANGETVYGLRMWERHEFEPQPDDVYQERLYAIKYEHTEPRSGGKGKAARYYRAPGERDMQNEEKVRAIVAGHLTEWQEQGLVPSMEIEPGVETERLARERGWKYWHQLYNPRQISTMLLYIQTSIKLSHRREECVISTLALNRMANWNSKLCQWSSYHTQECGLQAFYNQALNTFYNFTTRAFAGMKDTCVFTTNNYDIKNEDMLVELIDARDVSQSACLWITDPPYADAVSYHELSEVFLAWDKLLLNRAFQSWYTDSKRVLAIRGDDHFSQAMIDIYKNLTRHMSDNGMQIVMFTHSDPAVWAQLALIMWKAGLTVTAAWNIATETDASGLKDGNYVKGTVLLVLRKQRGDDEAFLDELQADIKLEVKNQIESMKKLDDKEDPNFSDPDYVLAAYAASLKVLTGYKAIGDIDLEYELDLAIHDPRKSEVVKLIERAKQIAYDFIIPISFDSFLWRELTPAERFYIKGLEAEKHGNCQVGTYQEYANGFGLTSYSQMMANERANTARLKAPTEFAMRAVNDVPDFENGILRLVLAAIHVSIKEDENPEMGLWHIKNNLPDYWQRRDMLRQLLAFLMDAQSIDTMLHWQGSARMAEHIYTLVDNDHI